MNARFVSPLLLTSMFAAACGGPVAPLQVGTQTVQVALILGEREAIVATPAPISLPPQTPIALPPIIIRITRPAPPPVLAPVPPPELCPQFSPIDPVVAADPVTSLRPAEATYPYRTQISGSLGGDEIAFEGETMWAVRDVIENANGSFSYSVDVLLDDEVQTTTTWRILPEGTEVRTGDNPLGLLPETPPEVAAPIEPGFYFESTTYANGGSFTPVNPIPIVQFPITTGTTYQTSGSDGVSTMSFTSTVGDRVKINACGTPLQAWQISLTEGSYATSASNGTSPVVNFTRTLFFAPQFGGLVVGDIEATTGSGTPGFPADSFSQSHTVNVQPEPGQVAE
ncbi:MAG: hypothetical protein ACI867_001845 [Glaciecola sp.]|jgi:hypothetical protein